ncbi:MAG: hypothetical protein ACP5RW_00400 [bacterium]
MSREELISKINEIDENITSIFDPLEISRLVIERGKLISLMPKVALSKEDSFKLLEANEKIALHLKKIELELERRSRNLFYSSRLIKSYYNLYRTKGALLSGEG